MSTKFGKNTASFTKYDDSYFDNTIREDFYNGAYNNKNDNINVRKQSHRNKQGFIMYDDPTTKNPTGESIYFSFLDYVVRCTRSDIIEDFLEDAITLGEFLHTFKPKSEREYYDYDYVLRILHIKEIYNITKDELIVLLKDVAKMWRYKCYQYPSWM